MTEPVNQAPMHGPADKMSLSEKAYVLLEFDAIRSQAASCALSEEAAAALRSAVPESNAEAAALLKKRVKEFHALMNAGPGEIRQSFPSIGFLFSKLDVVGACLEIDEAYALGIFVLRAEEFRAWVLQSGETGIAALARELPDCQAVSREVFRILTREGAIRDLPGLKSIRDRITRLGRERESLAARYTSGDEYRHMLQSALPSQRDGRLVLAVRANFRGRIKGIVHEVSSSGQTVFIEPEDVVEKNNEIRIEEQRLSAELRRILLELTGTIAEAAPALKALHEQVLYLEELRARSRFGFSRAYQHALDSDRIILKQARHPLLGKDAVPVDFVMEDHTRAVIITGPNTGGKTVTLKTVGLFALMNQAGLALPAGEGTALPFFDGVYADIGDEQSISQSLSTFSAHMTNIASITKKAAASSLVLLDELGSGTDPEEGSAIAMAILDHMLEKGARVLVTTHHGILKNYGYSRTGVENASVEFDGHTLSPTYRIVMGVPGESRALDIALRNGLPAELVDGARTYLAGERSDISALITGLKHKHQELDEALRTGRDMEDRLREERRQADLKELRLRQKELDLKRGSLTSLRRFLSESRKTLENLVREVREGELTREKTLAVKDFLTELETQSALQEASLAEEEALFKEAAGSEEASGDFTPAPGMEVLVGENKRRGSIVKAGKKGAWIVELGSVKMSVAREELFPAAPSREGQKTLIISSELQGAAEARMELNLRGMRLEEALEALQRQIDAASIAGLYDFAVIHGKGDGILQKGVHDFLSRQSAVAEYHFSRPELGGAGRTEVALKR
ncbi:MAG: endonuclease MutS2 [Spirochaetaceae bacterium]|jgi:DNA mismatch repair protein MutS2|nr:endonuclease MutS2 [Spirochaetaceae bacterium]